MEKEVEITVVTPTYNRANEIKNLYVSLQSQSCKLFNWLVIDDGSTDQTKQAIDGIDESDFRIDYYYKKNGGKHTAINYALEKIKTPLFLVVDSDDILTEDAIESILNESENISDSKLAGIVFRKSDMKGRSGWYEVTTPKFIGNAIKLKSKKVNNGIIFETAVVWKTKIIEQFPFPIFENEKYVPEGAVSNRVSENYDMLFINKIIYLFEYLEDGLTKSGRKLRINNPNGGIYLAQVVLKSKKFDFRSKIKWMLLYIVYSNFAKFTFFKAIKKIPHKLLYLLCFPFGYILYRYWRYKFGKDN